MFLAIEKRGRPAGFVASSVLLLLLALSVEPFVSRAQEIVSDPDGITSSSPRQKRLCLWVVRDALEDTVALAALADSARSVGCTDLLVQVRGRGEAYYRSRTEPAPQSLETPPPRGIRIGSRPSDKSLRYDPLAAAIRITKARGMQIHAWFNVFVAGSWNRERGPCHVLVRNPTWQIRLKDGRLTENLSEEERKRLALEGIFLDPGHPQVLAYFRGLISELIENYAIDGIHLDYIRYPWTDAGYGDESRATFLAAKNEGRLADDLSHPELDPWDAWRIGRVSLAVETIARTARSIVPGIEVSAAVVPDYVEALRSCKQDWPTWIRQGWCDRVYLMAYTKSTDRLDLWHEMISDLDPDGGHVVFGLGLHKLEPARLATVLNHLRGKGIVDLALFSDVQFMESRRKRDILRRAWDLVELR